VYLENAVGYSSLAEDYAWERTSRAEAEIRREQQRWYRQVSRWLKAIKHAVRRGQPREIGLIRKYIPCGRLLDIGCGSARTYRLLEREYTLFGIEISVQLAEEAAEVCQVRNGYVIRDHALGGLSRFDAGFFDGVVMISYLEHETQPREVLNESWRVLRSDGTLLVKVPNYASLNRRVMGARWCGYRFPDHVNYFTPTALSKMLQECGFVMRRFALRDRSPLSDNMWIIATKPRAACRKAA